MGTIRSCKFLDHFNYKEITQRAMESTRAKVLKDAIIIQKDAGYAFVFKHGVVIFWDIDNMEFLLQALSSSPYKISEEFTFKHANDLKIKIESDTIYLDATDELVMLSVSFAIAQSVKLVEFEDAMLQTLQQTEHIPQELAKTGRVSMARKEIAKERGRLFLTKSKIYLHFELLDTPEFFWEHPELEAYYLATRKYLDLQPRIEILGRKLTTLQEILTILADEQNHKHSSLLEWIIIILIAFEIVMSLFKVLV
ncbi:MAG: hypothetical protein RL113_1284 [Pseudomonadota bacterium]|jgi:uncharacterized Rmd1/YagE family protein